MDRLDSGLEELAQQVIGAAIEVHRHLGPGFAEATYQRALSRELMLRSIAHRLEAPVSITYKDQAVAKGSIDILVEEQLVVELKAAEARPRRYHRQVSAYLKATGLQLGLIINFDCDTLKDGLARVINTT